MVHVPVRVANLQRRAREIGDGCLGGGYCLRVNRTSRLFHRRAGSRLQDAVKQSRGCMHNSHDRRH